MLGNSLVVPTLPVVDLDRAKKFYLETLGLTVDSEDEWGTMLACGGGTKLLLYPRGATRADHTVASFEVDDVEAAVAELRAKGVVFQEYDQPGLKTENGVATAGESKAAWFLDPEGNILALGSSPD